MRKRTLGIVGAIGAGMAAPLTLAQATPADFGSITLPIDVASIATAVFGVGGVVLIALLALWIGFRLVKRAGYGMGKTV